jgi:retinol dehydrogenase 12
MHPPHLGALTPLYAATNPELKREDSGRYFMPWARPGTPKKGMQDVELAMKLWAFLEVQIEQGRQMGETS